MSIAEKLWQKIEKFQASPSRLATWLILVTCLVGLLVFWTQKSSIEEKSDARAKSITRALAESSLDDLMIGADTSVRKLAAGLAKQPDVKRIIIMDSKRKIVISDTLFPERRGLTISNKKSLRIYLGLLALNADSTETLTTDYGLIGRTSIPIRARGIKWGVATTDISLEAARKDIIWSGLRVGMTSLAIIFLVLILAASLRKAQQLEQEKKVADERSRIQQDSHDRIYNRLGALAKSCELALYEPDSMKETLKRVDRCLRETVSDLQEIVQGKETEDDSPFETALDELERVCRDHEKYSNQKVEFVCTNGIAEKLSHKDFWHIQCIVQECLNNTGKHTKASRVSVVLKTESPGNQEQIVLEVSDNGKGFSKPAGLDRLPDNCRGLRGIKKRAEQLGGYFSLESGKNGTEVRIKIPTKKKT